MIAHSGEFFQVVGHAPAGIVGEEGIADAPSPERFQEGDGPGEQTAAQIQGPVHVQGQVTDVLQLFHYSSNIIEVICTILFFHFCEVHYA